VSYTECPVENGKNHMSITTIYSRKILILIV